MAVLDHHENPVTPAEPNGYLAVFNVSLVFIGVLLLSYIFSLFV